MSSNNLRLFIAIELPPALKEALVLLQEELQRQLPPKVVRWVRPEGMHLTLKFLGDTAPARVDTVGAAMQKAARGFSPFTFQVEGLGCFPNPRKARVLWAGIPQVPQALVGLQRATDLQMSQLGWEREKRSFSPHLTLGRVNKHVPAAGREQLAALLAKGGVGDLGEVAVKEIILFQSDLRPGGAVYTALARGELSPGSD